MAEFLEGLHIRPNGRIIPQDCEEECGSNEACDVSRGLCIEVPSLINDNSVDVNETLPHCIIRPQRVKVGMKKARMRARKRATRTVAVVDGS
eukprot:TRINITY_DN1611_c0_g1_i1.p1 TRINITY_DN1611_c0_g1~~TRINITY_DN1611_c0_g1_i1.p1  ORF type:complete len:92 (+),score=15.95 TRINITY_DN1611_c0_g1_i1:282-557(+)